MECGGQLRKFGEDVSEQIEYIPESFKVVRHVRPKFTCESCDRVVEAQAPSRAIERGLAGPGLLAHVLVSKYCDHLPLYRQSEIYARQGVELSRSTLAGWVGATSELLQPLLDALGKYVFSGTKLHALTGKGIFRVESFHDYTMLSAATVMVIQVRKSGEGVMPCITPSPLWHNRYERPSIAKVSRLIIASSSSAGMVGMAVPAAGTLTFRSPSILACGVVTG